MCLKDDPKLIEEYKKIHEPNYAWKEITQGAKDVGIIDLEIYISGNCLFMIMDTIQDFEYEKAMDELSTKPRQQEWERFVSRFQQTSSEATSKEKWQLMERIFEMDQKVIYSPIIGQQKECENY